MIVIRVLLQVKPEAIAEFREHAATHSDASRAFDGCAVFQCFEQTDQEGSFLLYEEWETTEAFETYKASKTFEESGKLLFPLLADKPLSAYYQAEKFGP